MLPYEVNSIVPELSPQVRLLWRYLVYNNMEKHFSYLCDLYLFHIFLCYKQ
uniref:Uncharacterized protein n=1 Tax=Arundo donax TaxID=35708 RepID=A0A0A8YQH6_ARUDO